MPAVAKYSCGIRYCSAPQIKTGRAKDAMAISVTDIGWGLFDGCEKSVTVFCDDGSEIQRYCQRNGISEKRISEKEGL